MTPLHHASVAGDASVVRQLAEAGSRPDASDGQGRAPLHWAAGHAFVDVAEALLEAGAPSEPKEKEGWTPLHRCCQEKPPKIKSKKNKAEDEEKDKNETEPGNYFVGVKLT